MKRALSFRTVVLTNQFPILVDEAQEFDPGIRSRLIQAAESEFKLGRAQRISRQLRHIVGRS